MKDIGLVSCSKSKKSGKCKPKELYTESNLFNKKRKYVEENHEKWYILSAKHSLLDPDGPKIEPYDESLNNASKVKKKKWSEKVLNKLEEKNLLSDENKLILHAEKDYYEYLLPLLDEENVRYEIPTKGLGIGEKLSWYNKNL